jgi:hypothetical protein
MRHANFTNLDLVLPWISEVLSDFINFEIVDTTRFDDAVSNIIENADLFSVDDNAEDPDGQIEEISAFVRVAANDIVLEILPGARNIKERELLKLRNDIMACLFKLRINGVAILEGEIENYPDHLDLLVPTRLMM